MDSNSPKKIGTLERSLAYFNSRYLAWYSMVHGTVDTLSNLKHKLKWLKECEYIGKKGDISSLEVSDKSKWKGVFYEFHTLFFYGELSLWEKWNKIQKDALFASDLIGHTISPMQYNIATHILELHIVYEEINDLKEYIKYVHINAIARENDKLRERLSGLDNEISKLKNTLKEFENIS